MLRGERFREQKERVRPVDQRQRRRGIEGVTDVVLAQHTTHERTDDETQAERRPHHAVRTRAFLRRRHVSDVRHGDRDAGARDAVDRPRDEQDGQIGREGERDVVKARSKERDEQHRPPPHLV